MPVSGRVLNWTRISSLTNMSFLLNRWVLMTCSYHPAILFRTTRPQLTGIRVSIPTCCLSIYVRLIAVGPKLVVVAVEAAAANQAVQLTAGRFPEDNGKFWLLPGTCKELLARMHRKRICTMTMRNYSLIYN